jgi:hypothetical protein
MLGKEGAWVGRVPMPLFMVARLSQLKWILTTFNQVTVLPILQKTEGKKGIEIMIFCHLWMGLCTLSIDENSRFKK